MSFELVAYDLLQKRIKESIITLIKSNNKKAKINPDKLEDSVKEVSEERQPQVMVLLKTMDLLDKSSLPNEEKARVLNAFAYYIREQIAISYGWISPERSNFYNSLTTSLDLTKNNSPNDQDLYAMYFALEEFLRTNVYNNADPIKGYLVEQSFAIEKYSAVKDIRDLVQKVSELKLKIIEEAEKLHLQQQKPKATKSSWFFGGSSSKEESNKPHEDSKAPVL
ncbi:hypothetical protein EP47_05305 [Legionella norrlandica]|uniref:Dot/Icm T4SS effector n=1 Tax=Legionella norrlandica TaxID=1498499 RepID=A0A0A2SR00_9GAMM|nr:hypothetical protein [Legionella norrlandica]KGP63545.1 hypothetical protein EP47_05305 [Legionella norrlandica]